MTIPAERRPFAPAPAAQGRSVARRALRDSVYEMLLEKILDGSAAAGSALSIDALARELQVSPTPIREALVQLENTGLVSRVALKGYRVAPLMSQAELEQLFDMRMVLELAAAERAAPAAEALVPELRHAHAQHELAADTVRSLREQGTEPQGFADLRAYFDADWAFHLTFFRASGNHFLQQTCESLGSHVQRLRQTANRGVLDMEEALQEHRDILEAFENGDTEAITDAVRTHLLAVTRRATTDNKALTSDEPVTAPRDH